jgi:hypothetical protein
MIELVVFPQCPSDHKSRQAEELMIVGYGVWGKPRFSIANQWCHVEIKSREDRCPVTSMRSSASGRARDVYFVLATRDSMISFASLASDRMVQSSWVLR